MVIFKILNINIKNITHTKNNSKFYKNYKTTKLDTERLANTQTDRHSQVLNCLPTKTTNFTFKLQLAYT